MKGVVKAIIAGAIIFALGLGIFIIGLGVNGWDFRNVFADIEFTEKTFTAEEQATAIDAEFALGEVKIEYYDGETVQIIYPDADILKQEISESGGKITFRNRRRGIWSWAGFMLGLSGAPQTVVKLPAGQIFDLRLTLDAGTLDAEGLICGTLKVTVNAGKATLSSVQANTAGFEINAGSLYINRITCPDIGLEVNAGSITAKIVGDKSEYAIKRSVNAGSCNVGSQTGGDKSLDIEVNAGSCNVYFES